MYNVLKSIIRRGNYKLNDILHRIKQMHLLGELTEEQMFELMEMANTKANSEWERPEILQMLRTLSDRVDALAKEVSALKAGPDSTEPDAEPIEYEDWTPWDGISNKYQPGSIVRHTGKLWISTFEGQNVWEPGVVDDRFWKEYEEPTEPEPETEENLESEEEDEPNMNDIPEEETL